MFRIKLPAGKPWREKAAALVAAGQPRGAGRDNIAVVLVELEPEAGWPDELEQRYVFAGPYTRSWSRIGSGGMSEVYKAQMP